MGHQIKLTFTKQIPFKLSFNNVKTPIIFELYDTLKNGDIVFVDAYINERVGAKMSYVEPYVIDEKKGFIRCVFTTHWEQIGTTQLVGQLYSCPYGNNPNTYTYTVPVYAKKLYAPDIFETDELIVYTPSTIFIDELFNVPSIRRYLDLKVLENPQKYALIYLCVGGTYSYNDSNISPDEYLCAVLYGNTQYINYYLEKTAHFYSSNRLSLRQICDLGYIGYGVGITPSGWFDFISGEDRFRYLIRGNSLWYTSFFFNDFTAILASPNITRDSIYYHEYEVYKDTLGNYHCELEERFGGLHLCVRFRPLCGYSIYDNRQAYGLYRFLYDKKKKKLFFMGLFRDFSFGCADVYYYSKELLDELFPNISNKEAGVSHFDFYFGNIDIPESIGMVRT